MTDAGIIDQKDFWEPITSFGRVVAYRWRNMVLTEPLPWVSKEMPSWGGDCTNGHSVYGRAIPGFMVIQGERYIGDVLNG